MQPDMSHSVTLCHPVNAHSIAGLSSMSPMFYLIVAPEYKPQQFAYAKEKPQHASFSGKVDMLNKEGKIPMLRSPKSVGSDWC